MGIIFSYAYFVMVLWQYSASRHLVPTSLAERYPNDIGIHNDPNVLFAEDFEADTAAIFSRYSDIKNRKGIHPDVDVPSGSLGKQSVRLTSIGGVNDGAHLYKMIAPGWGDSVYVRYYVKYPEISNGYIHHESIKFGGNNPAIPYHQGQAGKCGLGDKRFTISYEPNNEPEMDTYLYWGEMRSWNEGSSCYGNTLVNGSSTARKLSWGQWICVEIMVKLNNPVTARNGSIRVWQDGVEVGYWGPGFPTGRWEKDRWINEEKGLPFEGFQWRTDKALDFNFLRIEHYDSKSPKGEDHYTKFDHLVVATQYIGPIAERHSRRK